jgi:tetratricopeptide (TPR) repeat protein
VNEVRAYLVALGVLISIGAMYVWFAAPPIPPPPEIDTSRASPAIVSAIEEALVEARNEPDSALARGRLGMLCYAHEFRHEALECFQQAVRLDPQQFRWRYYKGIVEEDFNLSDAAETYRHAQRYRPSYAPLFMRYGNLLVRLNRPEEARRKYLQAAELAPGSADPLLGLARLEMSLGHLKEAEQRLQQALEINSSSRDVLVEKIRLMRMRGDLIAAADLEETASLLPQTRPGMPDEFLAVMEQEDKSSNRLARTADALLSQERFDEAADLLQRLIQTRPDLARLRINLGQIRLRQRRLPEATQIFRDAVQLFPNDPLCRFALGTALESDRQWKSAAAAYAEAGRLKPDYSEAMYRHGRVLSQLDQHADAVTPLQACLTVDPVHSRARALLIQTLQKLNRKTEAIALAKETVTISPRDPEALELLKKLIASEE